MESRIRASDGALRLQYFGTSRFDQLPFTVWPGVCVRASGVGKGEGRSERQEVGGGFNKRACWVVSVCTYQPPLSNWQSLTCTSLHFFPLRSLTSSASRVCPCDPHRHMQPQPAALAEFFGVPAQSAIVEAVGNIQLLCVVEESVWCVGCEEGDKVGACNTMPAAPSKLLLFLLSSCPFYLPPFSLPTSFPSYGYVGRGRERTLCATPPPTASREWNPLYSPRRQASSTHTTLRSGTGEKGRELGGSMMVRG